MLKRQELRRIAQARLRDAEVLFRAKRYDGAFYLCGYALEVALKARVCRTLRWQEFPATAGEFQGLTSFKTHDLDILLLLSGREQSVRSKYLTEWTVVTEWDPEARYRPIGTATAKQTSDTIAAVTRIIKRYELRARKKDQERDQAGRHGAGRRRLRRARTT